RWGPSPSRTRSRSSTVCRRRAAARSCAGSCGPKSSACRSATFPRWKTARVRPSVNRPHGNAPQSWAAALAFSGLPELPGHGRPLLQLTREAKHPLTRLRHSFPMRSRGKDPKAPQVPVLLLEGRDLEAARCGSTQRHDARRCDSEHADFLERRRRRDVENHLVRAEACFASDPGLHRIAPRARAMVCFGQLITLHFAYGRRADPEGPLEKASLLYRPGQLGAIVSPLRRQHLQERRVGQGIKALLREAPGDGDLYGFADHGAGNDLGVVEVDPFREHVAHAKKVQDFGTGVGSLHSVPFKTQYQAAVGY